MNLYAKATDAHPVHWMFVKFSQKLGRYLIKHCKALVALLAIFTLKSSNEQEEVVEGTKKSLASPSIVFQTDSLRTTYSKAKRGVKRHNLLKSSHRVLQQLRLFLERWFSVLSFKRRNDVILTSARNPTILAKKAVASRETWSSMYKLLEMKWKACSVAQGRDIKPMNNGPRR